MFLKNKAIFIPIWMTILWGGVWIHAEFFFFFLNLPNICHNGDDYDMLIRMVYCSQSEQVQTPILLLHLLSD